jgi:hypothetical protein
MEFVRGMLKERDAMRGEMERRMIYGSGEFPEKIKREYEIEEVIKPKGRPRKAEEYEK